SQRPCRFDRPGELCRAATRLARALLGVAKADRPADPHARAPVAEMSRQVAGRTGGASVARPSGLLRALVLFHEPELLGAATSVLNVVEALREYGWSVSGWIPGAGSL